MCGVLELNKLVALVLLSSLLLFGCLHEGGKAVATPTPTGGAIGTPAATIQTPTLAATPAPVTVKIRAQSNPWKFEPSEIRVKRGTAVTLEISVKDDDVPHGFGLQEFEISKSIEPGATEKIEFVADKPPGEYPFFCTIFCGSGHSGMKGKLIIE